MTLFLLSVVAFVLIMSGAMAYLFRELRDLRRLPRRGAEHSSPYRAPFSDAGLAPTTDPGEAWQAGVAAERARVLTLVRAARDASSYTEGARVADAIRDGVKAGPV